MQEQQDSAHTERMAGNLALARAILFDPLAVAMHLEQMLDDPELRTQAGALVDALKRRRMDRLEGDARAS